MLQCYNGLNKCPKFIIDKRILLCYNLFEKVFAFEDMYYLKE